MPDLTSAALFERDGKVLVAHRSRAPFAGQWMLPIAVVREDEAAEDALRRHARDQFGVGLGQEAFVETVYLVDPATTVQYVANIFRTPIEGGPMRFNADGDYDDARWMTAGDLEQLWMPPDLRVPLIKILTEPESLHETDWDRVGAEMTAQATPMAERPAEEPAVTPEPAPDNRAAWDAIADAYQREFYGERYEGRLMWSWTLPEDDVHLLDEVRGKRVLVLGCGGGQDCVALDRMGAIAVGIDESSKQIAYARRYAARHEANNASFVVGTVEDLSRFDNESFAAAVSAHVLNYVERIDHALRETNRVLKPGSAFSLSVRHPFDASLSNVAPFRVERAYWDAAHNWTWSFATGEAARFRQWFWPVSRWLEMLDDAEFAVERLLEPREPAIEEKETERQRRRLVPYSLLIKARKR